MAATRLRGIEGDIASGQAASRLNNAILEAMTTLTLEEVLNVLLQNAAHLSRMINERVVKEVRG